MSIYGINIATNHFSKQSTIIIFKTTAIFFIDFIVQVILYTLFHCMRSGRIAQLAEPSAHNRSVVGSNPTAPTNS